MFENKYIRDFGISVMTVLYLEEDFFGKYTNR